MQYRNHSKRLIEVKTKQNENALYLLIMYTNTHTHKHSHKYTHTQSISYYCRIQQNAKTKNQKSKLLNKLILQIKFIKIEVSLKNALQIITHNSFIIALGRRMSVEKYI